MTKLNPILSQLTLTPANFTDTSIVKPKSFFPFNLKNFNQLHPNSKICRVRLHKGNRFVRKGGFFRPTSPNSSPQLSWNRPRNPVMSEGRFWRQIFQALRTGLNQFVHLASGGGELRSWPRGQKGVEIPWGDGATRFQVFLWYSTCQMWRVEIILSFWMSNSILSLSAEWGGWLVIVGNPGVVTLGVFFCSSKPRTLTTKQPLAGNDTLYLYVHNIACIHLIYKFEFIYGMHMFLAYKGCFFLAERNGHPVCLKTPKKISKRYITYNFIPKKKTWSFENCIHFGGCFSWQLFWVAPDKQAPKNQRSPRSSWVTWKTRRKQWL